MTEPSTRLPPFLEASGELLLLVVPDEDGSATALPLNGDDQTVRCIERVLHALGYSRSKARAEAPRVIARGIVDAAK